MKTAGPTFSLCMILCNEAANLSQSLGLVSDCFNEIIVVDTGSADGTKRLARSYGARVIEIEWPDDFAAARNVSLEAATGDWIMWLDGDNSVSPADVEILRRHLDTRRQSILWCTEVVVPAGERLVQKRVFPRRPEVYFTGRVHEQLVHPASYSSIMTPVEIRHWGYADKAGARAKGERNLCLLKKMALDQPQDLYLCYQTGRTLLNLRRFDQALTWLKKATAAESAKEQNRELYLHARVLEAQALERLGRRFEAKKTLSFLVQLAPDYGPGHFGLARLEYSQGEYEAAADRFRSFLELGGGDIVAGLNIARMRFLAAMLLGRSLEKTGHPGQAEEVYAKAVSIDPENPEPGLALARLSWESGRKEEAKGFLADCLKLRPNDRRANELLHEIKAHV